MNPVYAFLLSSTPFVLIAVAWLTARRASYKQGKADAFQQIADDFRGLTNATWMRDKAAQVAERRQRWLNLALCDPRVCDALDDALTEAREYWKHHKEVNV